MWGELGGANESGLEAADEVRFTPRVTGKRKYCSIRSTTGERLMLELLFAFSYDGPASPHTEKRVSPTRPASETVYVLCHSSAT